MFIKSLELENWKCFSERLHLEFSNIEIFSFPNGSGKSSVLEAINYGIWGKADNKLALYQNHEGQTKVKIAFEVDDNDYITEREFPNNKAILYKNGKEFKNGIKEIYEYMNSILDFNIIKRLWFKGDITESEVLDFNFFKKEILGEKLREPLALNQYYSQLSRSKSKEANAIIVNEDCRDLKDIEKEIKEITSKIKDRTNTTDLQYSKALTVKKANEDFENLKKSFKDFNIEVISKDDINKWKQINFDSITKQLNEEKSKFTDEVISNVSSSILKNIVSLNHKYGKCVICDGSWTKEREAYIKNILDKGLKDNTVIESLEEKIKFKNSIPENVIEKSEEFYSLEQQANSLPNYEEIISSYNKENDLLWDKLDDLNSERDIVMRNKDNLDRKSKLLQEKENCKKKAEFIKHYLDKATEYYTATLLEKSSEILSSINKDYSDISIDLETSSLMVTVREEILNIGQLSRGEKTLVALSLIYSIRDIFTPLMPLIFDESFAALSEENNYKVIWTIKDSPEQLFIVSHNPLWVDFGSYNENTNVRTSWE